MEGVPFDLEQFSESLANNDGVNCEIGSTIKGTVFNTDANGAMVDILVKAPT